jgi:hypothetical protein
MLGPLLGSWTASARRRPSSSDFATSIDGSGPPRSRLSQTTVFAAIGGSGNRNANPWIDAGLKLCEDAQ